MPHPDRRPLRLARFDYTTPGAYFVTIVTHRRRRLLAEVSASESVPTPAGRMVRQVWADLPRHYGVDVDVSVVMPDHLHGILWVSRPVPTGETGLGLPGVLQRFKSMTTRRYVEGVRLQGWERFDQHLWQRSYYDRVLRNPVELDAFREYTLTNPRRWELAEAQSGRHRGRPRHRTS